MLKFLPQEAPFITVQLDFDVLEERIHLFVPEPCIVLSGPVIFLCRNMFRVQGRTRHALRGRDPSEHGEGIKFPLGYGLTEKYPSRFISDAHVDPGGPLPAWITNVLLVDAPFQTMTRMRAQLDAELARLTALAEHNPAVRSEELEALQQERQALSSAIEKTRLRLDSVRVIITVDPNAN